MSRYGAIRLTLGGLNIDLRQREPCTFRHTKTYHYFSGGQLIRDVLLPAQFRGAAFSASGCFSERYSLFVLETAT